MKRQELTGNININEKYEFQAVRSCDEASMLYKLAKINIRHRDYISALLSINKAIALDPLFRKALFKKIEILKSIMVRHGKDLAQEIISCYDQIIMEYPDDFEMYYKKAAFLFYIVGDNEAALRCYDQVIEKNPGNVGFYYGEIGYKLNKLGKYREALRYLKKAIILEANIASHYNNMAYTLHYLKDTQGALECYNQAIKLESQSKTYHLNKIFFLIERQDYEQALQSCLDAINQDPKHKEIYDTKMSNIYADNLKDYELAIFKINEILISNPYNRFFWYQKAVLYNKMNDPIKKEQCYQTLQFLKTIYNCQLDNILLEKIKDLNHSFIGKSTICSYWLHQDPKNRTVFQEYLAAKTYENPNTARNECIKFLRDNTLGDIAADYLIYITQIEKRDTPLSLNITAALNILQSTRYEKYKPLLMYQHSILYEAIANLYIGETQSHPFIVRNLSEEKSQYNNKAMTERNQHWQEVVKSMKELFMEKRI